MIIYLVEWALVNFAEKNVRISSYANATITKKKME